MRAGAEGGVIDATPVRATFSDSGDRRAELIAELERKRPAASRRVEPGGHYKNDA